MGIAQTFGVRRSQAGKPVIPKDPRERVSSFSFSDQELRRATTEAVCVVHGSASLSRTQPGDLARSFFGQVQR